MDDTSRTHVQDFLEDFCNVEQDDSEDLAEMLDKYLIERGYSIIDFISFHKDYK